MKLKYFILPIIILALSYITALVFWPKMPNPMASHWNAAGQVDGYTSKFWGIFLLPIINIFVLILFSVLPKIDPKKENIAKFEKAFYNFISVIMLFLFSIYLFTIAWNLGYQFNIMIFMSIAFAVLFYFIGDLISVAEPNFTIGIRTPWTLSSEKSWRKTHELGGKLFKIAAILSLVGIIIPEATIYIVFLSIIPVTIFLFVYSYLKYKKG